MSDLLSTRHVALLRGINLGKACQMDMPRLRACLAARGFTYAREALSMWAGQSVALARQPQPAAEIVAELVAGL